MFSALLLTAFLCATSSPASDPAGPDIVIITADNLGYGDVGCYGNERIKTPRLDRLAAAGVRCTRFYTASPTCTASRAALLTGRYPQRNGLDYQLPGIAGNYGVGLRTTEILLPQLLLEAGYRTACFGKWNIGFAPGSRPTDRGFEEFFGHASGNMDYYRHVYDGRLDLHDGTEPVQVEGYSTDLFADRACAWIRRHARERFFLYLPFNAPHFPNPKNKRPGEPCVWQAPREAFAAYGASADTTDERARYCAVVTALDAAIGRVVDELEACGLTEKTLLVFFSDNGAFMLPGRGLEVASNGPLRSGGVTLWEGGIRVPCIVRWPERLPAGRICRQPFMSCDLLPMALAAAGAPVPRDRIIDGRDPTAALAGRGPSPHKALFFRFGTYDAVVCGRRKLLRTRSTEPWQLYDLEEDIGETRDRRAQEPAAAADLSRRFERWLASLPAADGGADAPIVLDSTKQLFLDDHLIASMSRVGRTIERARKFPRNPVLWPEEDGEPPVAVVYGSVLRDGDRYRTWYTTGGGVAYAESDDGISWIKPRLDRVVVDGRRTNFLFRKTEEGGPPPGLPYFHELFGVHRDDRDPDPSRRYKMGFLSIDRRYSGPGGDPWHRGQRRGLGVAGSPDGIRWALIESWATEAIVDGATHWMFDPIRNAYVLYGRTKKALPEVVEAWRANDWFGTWFWGRAVARVESPDFLHWDFGKPDTAPVVMTADLRDPPGTEIYSMKVFRYEGICIGLVQVFHATPAESTLDVQLAVSRDGLTFERVGDRSPFIALGPIGAWDRFNLSLANNDPIPAGDELRFYYGGRMYRHGPYSGPDKGPARGGIGFATIPRDRFVALEASFDGGEIITRPLVLRSSAIHVNAKSDFGEITVEVLDATGASIARSNPIRGDAIDIPIEWKGSAPRAAGGPVRLRIRLSNARLFAVWSE
ncbi:MAG: sulfatase-like hydrolase/transferase [Planctomycetes bacterium]|nr:sulfatase-like hydrolase/transferase [Planctomycetota bacterium]